MTFLFNGGMYSNFLVTRLNLFRMFVWMRSRTGNPSKLLSAGFRRPVDPRVMENYLASELPNNSMQLTALRAAADAEPDRTPTIERRRR